VLLTTLEIDDRLSDYLVEQCFILGKRIQVVVSAVFNHHLCWVQDMKFGEVKVVVVLSQQLDGLLLKNAAASQKHAIALGGSFTHDKVAQVQVVVHLGLVLVVHLLLIFLIKHQLRGRLHLYLLLSSFLFRL